MSDITTEPKAFIDHAFSANPSRPVPNETAIDPRQEHAVRLMQERGLDVSAHHPIYTDADIAIRDACVAEAFGSTPARWIPDQPAALHAHVSIEEARDILKQCKLSRDEAEHYLEVANKAAHRAKVRVQELSDQVQNFVGLDEAIVQHSVDAIKQDKEAVLPLELQHKQTMRTKALERFTAAQSALDRLAKEQHECEAACIAARQRVSQMAVIVIQLRLEELVPTIIEQEDRAGQLRTELLSFASTYFQMAGSGPKPGGTSPLVASLLREAPSNANVAVDSITVERLQALHRALMADPDAAL